MKVAGKCPPEPEELQAAERRGFERVELYLEKAHLENFEKTVENCRNASVDICSVHTPHVTQEELEYFQQASRLAENLEAKLVVHSQYILHVHVPQIQGIELEAEHGYENNPGSSLYALENLVLGRGESLVLDTAHLFIGERSFQRSLEKVLKDRAEEIMLIHLCDSTSVEDGLPFGEGEMDMEETIRKVKNSNFDGLVVLEVMPEHQEKALEFWNSL